MREQAIDMVVRKEVTVPLPPAEAFRLYTDDIATWWPLRKHAVEPATAATAVFEARPGGRIFERTVDGKEHIWGIVTECDPPNRVVYTWHPGRAETTAQEVEMRFVPDGAGTRVEVEHRGWERYGDGVESALESYETGWDFVLGRYVESAGDGA